MIFIKLSSNMADLYKWKYDFCKGVTHENNHTLDVAMSESASCLIGRLPDGAKVALVLWLLYPKTDRVAVAG